jgi:hypothetical protein
LTFGEFQSAAECIENAEDDGDIGKGVSTLRTDNNGQIRGNIRTKGVWD